MLRAFPDPSEVLHRVKHEPNSARPDRVIEKGIPCDRDHNGEAERSETCKHNNPCNPNSRMARLAADQFALWFALTHQADDRIRPDDWELLLSRRPDPAGDQVRRSAASRATFMCDVATD